MAVVAITPIQYGLADGTIDLYDVGDELDLPEETLQTLVWNGSAVETGKKRKFTPLAGAAGPVDEVTIRRDALIAKAAAELDDGAPEAETPAVAPVGGTKAPQTPAVK